MKRLAALLNNMRVKGLIGDIKISGGFVHSGRVETEAMWWSFLMAGEEGFRADVTSANRGKSGK